VIVFLPDVDALSRSVVDCCPSIDPLLLPGYINNSVELEETILCVSVCVCLIVERITLVYLAEWSRRRGVCFGHMHVVHPLQTR